MDTQAPATDDQELAKVLESMNNNLTTSPTAPIAAPDEPADTSGDDASFAVPAPTELPAVPEPVPVVPSVEPIPEPAPVEPEPVDPQPVMPEPIPAPVEPLPSQQGVGMPADPALENIKKDALEELRPLVDKLELAPEEKFDTLLLIIRSTDDRSLVSAAHDAAKAIGDETKRAAALLDVIKEIDYFSQGH